eukprot:6174211-Pleurochrysis_carterae.AAC.1
MQQLLLLQTRFFSLFWSLATSVSHVQRQSLDSRWPVLPSVLQSPTSHHPNHLIKLRRNAHTHPSATVSCCFRTVQRLLTVLGCSGWGLQCGPRPRCSRAISSVRCKIAARFLSVPERALHVSALVEKRSREYDLLCLGLEDRVVREAHRGVMLMQWCADWNEGGLGGGRAKEG